MSRIRKKDGCLRNKRWERKIREFCQNINEEEIHLKRFQVLTNALADDPGDPNGVRASLTLRAKPRKNTREKE